MCLVTTFRMLAVPSFRIKLAACPYLNEPKFAGGKGREPIEGSISRSLPESLIHDWLKRGT